MVARDPDAPSQDAAGDSPATENLLEEIAAAWWSRYCPVCSSRHAMSDAVCSRDGAALRDLSVCVRATERPTLTYCPEAHAPRSGSEDASTLDPLLRRTLGGKWRVSQRGGSGAFGVFYVGHHSILGMKVGIKILRSKYTDTEFGRRLFYQEALRVSGMDHPNIVKVLDYGEEEDLPFLVMEYLSGKPLHAYLREGRLSLEEGVEIIRQAALALSVAHKDAESGDPIVHLDIKPEHIYVEQIHDEWRVKVIDFGIAEIVAAREKSGESRGSSGSSYRIAGTLPYMPPERWEGVVDPRCDIYSLGVVLYEVVAGRHPFEASDPRDMRMLHEEERPAPPSLHRSGKRTALLKELDSIVLWTLEKKPDDRPPTAEAFVQALERWQARPRISASQRALRAALVPLGVALLAAALLYWAPWEEVLLPEELLSRPLLLGPQRESVEISAAVFGTGYDGAEAVVRLDDGQRSATVPLGGVEEHRVRGSLTWGAVQAALGSPPAGRWDAAVHVEGSLGRTAVSESFTMRLDDQPPAFELGGSVIEEAGRLWLTGRELRITADEPLDADACAVNDSIEPEASPSQTAVQVLHFSLPKGTSELKVRLVDLAGNPAERTWTDVAWEEAPRVLAPREIFTNAPERDLSFEIEGGTPGRIQIEEGGQRDEIPVDREASVYHWPIRFRGDPSRGEQRKTARLRVWSELSARRGGEAETPTEIRLVFLKRQLSILKTKEASRDGLPAFRVVDARTGEDVDHLRTWCRLWLDDGERDHPIAEARIEPSTGALQADLTGLKGKCTLLVEAKDRYGNEGYRKFFFPHDIDEARVSFSLASNVGSREEPLHHAGCSCRRPGWEDERLSFAASIQYPFADQLRVKLTCTETATSWEPPALFQIPGGYRIRLGELLPRLRPGEANELLLEAWDEGDPENSRGQAVCFVHVEAPAALEVLPEEGPLGAERVLIELVQKGGRAAGAVLVDGEPARKEERNRWSREVVVRAAGITTVELKVRLAGGCEQVDAREYWRRPEEEQRYLFDFGAGVGRIPLEFFDGDDRFWYMPDGVSEKLVSRFRRLENLRSEREPGSISGERGGRDGETGVSWLEASRVAAWLTSTLRKSGRIGPDDRFSLPEERQWRLLCESGRLPWSSRQPRWEWLSDEEKEWVFLGETVSSGKSNRKVLARRHESQEDFTFRLVLPYSGDGSRVHPKNALSSTPTGDADE